MKKFKVFLILLVLGSIFLSCSLGPDSGEAFKLIIRDASSNSMILFWGTHPDANSYTLSYSSSRYGSYSELYSGKDNTYTHTGLTPDTTYYYKIVANNRDGIVATEILGARTYPSTIVLNGNALAGYIQKLTSTPFDTWSTYEGNVEISHPLY